MLFGLTVESRARLYPFFWASLIFALGEIVTFAVVLAARDFLEESRAVVPEISLELALTYFFGVVVAMGVTLFLIPISKLRLVLKAMFAFLFFWGIFIILWLTLPVQVAVVVALVGGLMWFFKPKIWLHNLLLILTLVSSAVVFGAIIVPWSVLLLLLVISVYDVLAVRFGYMLWLARKLSQSESLPAFVIPKRISGWNLELKETEIRRLIEDKAAEREFSILGGGDIGFPLLLIVSVFFAYDFTGSVIVAVFSLVGLGLAYWVQQAYLKGKPLPALAPISLGSFVGFLIVHFVL